MAGGGVGGGLYAVGSAPVSGGGLFSAFSAMPGFAKSMLGNIAMSFISSLFNKKPKAQQETDQSTRENGMFGGLTNSTQSGTPIALHYGLVRVAGQFISGYIESEEHAKNDVVKVGDKF
jgi:predicted phage tail protein